MVNNSDIYKYYLYTILLSPFLGYFSGKGIIAYGPIIIMSLIIIINELFMQKSMKLKDWGAFIVFIPYTIWASYYYVSNPLNGNLLTTNLLAIISLPFIILSLLRLKLYSPNYNYDRLIYKIILFFLIAEFLICLGQISTYLTGFGLPINEIYRDYFMVTGTFFNSNDLGAVVLLISFIFTTLEKNIQTYLKFFIWILIFSLLIISGSRSALLVTSILFIITRGFNIKNLLFYVTLSIICLTIYQLVFSNIENNIISRFIHRIDSLVNILTDGINNDNSANLRLNSYIHFLSQISNLEFGSGELYNYYQFSDNTHFNSDLMFQNPHALIVEIGYWLGWPGLLFFTAGLIYLLRYSEKKLWLIIVVTIATIIPSSILGNLICFLFIFICFFRKISPPQQFIV